MKDLQKRKFLLDTALEFCNKLLNIYKTQNDKLTKTQTKRIKVQNMAENY